MAQQRKQKIYGKQRSFYEQKSNSIIRILAAVFFIGITAVYPLIISDRKYGNIVYPKIIFLWVFTGITVIIILAAMLFLGKHLRVRNYFIENEPIRSMTVSEYALLIFILFAYVSALLSYCQNIVWFGYPNRMEGFLTFLCYILSFFLIARFYRPKNLHFLLFALSAIIVSLICVLQFVGYDIFKLFPFEALPDYGHLTAYCKTTLGNIDIVSSYGSITVVLFAALFSESKVKWRLIYLIASAMSFALIMAVDRDAGKVGIVVAMILLIPFWIYNRRRLGSIFIVLACWCLVYAGYNAYISALKMECETDPSLFAPADLGFLWSFKPLNTDLFCLSAIILLILGLCLIFILKKWPKMNMTKITGAVFLIIIFTGSFLFIEIMGAKWADQPNNMIWEAREILHGRFDDSFGSNRIWIWKRGFASIFKNPVLGTGPDTFYYALGEEHQTESYELYGVVFDKAHNIFLQTALCLGLPALLAYIVFIGNLLLSAVKKAFDRPVLFSFFAASLSYLIQSFFAVEVPIVTPLFWVSLGVIAGELWFGKIGVNTSV